MFYVLQNESDGNLRRVPILLTDAATGTTAQSGVATTNIFPYVNINGGAFAGGAGTVGEAGYGQYYYQMDSTEIGSLGLAGIHITAVGCRNYDAIAQIAAFNVYSSVGLGLTAGDVWDYDISAITSAGLAGKQLNDAAAGGGTTAFNIDQAVWDYSPALYNFGSSGEYLAETRTEAYAASNNTNDIGNQVWNRDPVSTGDNLTGDYFGAYLYQLGTGTTGYPSGGGAGLTAGAVSDAVWNSLVDSYTTSGSFGLNILRTDNAGIAGSVTLWNGASYNGVFADTYRIDASYDAAIALKNVLTGIGSSITSDITGNITGSVGSVTADVNVSTASMAGVANTVWSTLTAPYTTHATFGHQVLRSDNAATIGEVTLHQSGGSKRVDADVHAFVNNTASATAMLNILTGIGASITSNITGSLSGSVASVTSPVSVATASMTGIAGTVWTNATRTITGGTITTVSDKTGYSLSGTQSFNLTGNITGSVSGSVGSVTGSVGSVVSAVTLSAGTQASIGNSVWLSNISTYVSPSAGYALNAASGGGVALTAGDIWSYNSRTLTSSAGATAGDVWSYVLSNTDTAEQNLVSAAGGGIALTTGDIWSYNTRTLTSGAGITVIGAVQLVNGPYKLTSNQNNSDGILDILQNSVQEINLNLIDGNGSPASTAGYASIINIFDVAGVAVTSYTPTVEYADGGILNFELDTDVTSTIGRYNLIVGLSGAGFNVKYGPLQILVRPL